MELNFNTLKTVENLKADLKKAYLKQAKIRSDKAELEKKLDSLNAKLDGNTDVAEVLKSRKYVSIKDLTTDKKFLKDVEAEAVSDYKKLKKLKGKAKALTTDQKWEHLKEVFKENKNKAMSTSEITAALLKKKAIATGGNLQQWLKALNLPAHAITKGKAKRDGTTYDPAKIGELRLVSR